MVKTVGKYDLYGTLGEGAFGKVKYSVNTETNEAVAIKILDKDKIQSRNMGAQIKKEIAIMKMINHHHVVGVKDVFATSAKIFIVLEFVGGGELFDKIANEGKLPEDKARFYFRQLVEGLEHCHDRGICHRDLKPENLLLDTAGNLKISDFGFSTLSIGDPDGDGGARAELLHTTCGTPNYVAPEVLGKDGYDGKKADIWSIGVILYVLLAGYLPFDENTMAALFQKIKHAEFDYPDWFSSEARDLISKILVPDPTKRPNLGELKLHPWMKRGDSGPEPMAPVNHQEQYGAPKGVIVPGTTPPPVAHAPHVAHAAPAPAPAPIPAVVHMEGVKEKPPPAPAAHAHHAHHVPAPVAAAAAPPSPQHNGHAPSHGEAHPPTPPPQAAAAHHPHAPAPASAPTAAAAFPTKSAASPSAAAAVPPGGAREGEKAGGGGGCCTVN